RGHAHPSRRADPAAAARLGRPARYDEPDRLHDDPHRPRPRLGAGVARLQDDAAPARRGGVAGVRGVARAREADLAHDLRAPARAPPRAPDLRGPARLRPAAPDLALAPPDAGLP